MNILFWALGVIAFLYGFVAYADAMSVSQQTHGLIALLIGTVFVTGGAILGAIKAGGDAAEHASKAQEPE